jgi:hypothetical protein
MGAAPQAEEIWWSTTSCKGEVAEPSRSPGTRVPPLGTGGKGKRKRSVSAIGAARGTRLPARGWGGRQLFDLRY